MHGGDIYSSGHNHIKLDFSVNINPLGMPERVKNALHDAVEDCRRYPDIRAEELRRAVSEMAGIKDRDILCGNGASALFPAVVHAVNPGNVLIPAPSFYGYERAAKAGTGNEKNIRYYKMEESEDFRLTERFLQELSSDTGLLFLANPNNPSGNLIHPVLLEKILKTCRNQGTILVLDECFIEFCAEYARHSLIQKIYEYPNLVVVRAFTKIFAMPGVRLGYLACADPALRRKIEIQLPEWDLSVFAQKAGTAAAKENGYRERTAELVREERAYLKKELQKMGLAVYPSDANFLLVYTKEALGEKLLERGILIRDCSNFRGLSKGFYRIAVRAGKDNRTLTACIREVLNETDSML